MGSKRKRHRDKLQRAGLTPDSIQSTLYDKTTEYGEVYGQIVGTDGVILGLHLGAPASFPEEDYKVLLSEFHGDAHTFIEKNQYGWRTCACGVEPFAVHYNLQTYEGPLDSRGYFCIHEEF